MGSMPHHKKQQEQQRLLQSIIVSRHRDSQCTSASGAKAPKCDATLLTTISSSPAQLDTKWHAQQFTGLIRQHGLPQLVPSRAKPVNRAGLGQPPPEGRGHTQGCNDRLGQSPARTGPGPCTLVLLEHLWSFMELGNFRLNLQVWTPLAESRAP